MLRASITLLVLLGCSVSLIDAKDRALSSSDIAHIKHICRQSIGLPFRDAFLPVQLAPFAQNQSDIVRPWTNCDGRYCSGAIRLRDDAVVVFTFMHVQPNWKTAPAQDITPDVGQKGNNRHIGVELIKNGKVIFSEGHIDGKTSNHAMERTADRVENLRMTTSKVNFGAQLAFVSGRSSPSR